jgi:hypothetical protein
LAILKHLWIWGPENDLNTLSTSINQATNENSISIIPRKFSHILREALLIKCMSKSECATITQKVKSYAKQALLQSIFDRIAFKTTVPPIFTILSRFFYLIAVKEVIDLSSQLIQSLEEKKHL